MIPTLCMLCVAAASAAAAALLALRFKDAKTIARLELELEKAAGQEDDFETRREKLAEANLALLARNEAFEEQRFQLAEANVSLLEQQELLEEQKIKMAEANLQLMEQKEIIESERQRSEKLLLNILPSRVADELKNNGRTEPESFDDVTVFFSDIVNFTTISSRLEPKVLIDELNEIFTAFDHIIARHHCERIKTIGDAYLCVCGMPEANPRHAHNIVSAAIEILDYLDGRNRDHELKWEIRVGVHSGRVVGGVVGVVKYIYDVFGDTINTAARMESHSEPMRVNASQATRDLVGDEFEFTARPPLEVKGKGAFNMFFLETGDCHG